MVPRPRGGDSGDEDGRAPRKEARTLLAEEKGLPAGLSVRNLFWTEEECRSIERDINGIKALADAGRLKNGTVDRTPLRSKYFFGYGYTYGAQVSGKGQEQLLPPDYVDPIPDWVRSKLITRLEDEAIVPKGWINSAVVNDYSPGGMIVSHIDPKQLFARPICIATFFAEGRLVFGVQFAFADRRFSSEKSSVPKFVASMPRGSLTLMDGFSADGITHGIRPEDFDGRRVSVVLRHVFPDAPTMSDPTAVLKPAQRGAPASAARRVGPGAAMALLEDRRAGSETKRPLKSESPDKDEPPAKSRRRSPPSGHVGGARASSLEMLRRIQGTYSDERSGNVYEVTAGGAVRVTIAPTAFVSEPQTATWKVEPDGEGRLVCGKGHLTSSGIRSDRLVWTRRDGGGPDLVWLRADGDAAAAVASTGAGRLLEGDAAEDSLRVVENGDLGLLGAGAAAAQPLLQESLLQSLASQASSGPPAVRGHPAGLPRGLAGAIRGPTPAAVSGLSSPALQPLRPGLVPGSATRLDGGGSGSSPVTSSLPAFLRPLRGPTNIIRPSGSVGSLTAIGPGRPGSLGTAPASAMQRLAQTTGPFAAARGLRALGCSGQAADGSLPLPPGWKRPDGYEKADGVGLGPSSGPLAPGLVLADEPVVPVNGQRKWYYRDTSGCVQGPFSSSVMSEWSRKGFFPEETLVRAEDEETFSELGNGMRLLAAALLPSG